MNLEMNISIVVTQEEHYKYAQEICDTIESSALLRGTGIAKRTPEYIIKKMEKGDAVIALNNGIFAGFCYIESWQHGQFVAHSGLIVHPDYRNLGLAKKIKSFVFDYSLKKISGRQSIRDYYMSCGDENQFRIRIQTGSFF